MTLVAEVNALRSSAGLSRATQIAIVRVEGADALEFLQRASTQSPYVREGRVRHTLLLRDDACVFADAFIVNVDGAFLVIAEGPTEQDIVAWLSALKERWSSNVEVNGTSDAWVALGVDGPYAWEVVAGAMGPASLGMPYLSLYRREDTLCMRAGKTGEYGYLFVTPRASAAEVEAKILEVGSPLDLTSVSVEALDVCALESWHFSMRNAGSEGLTPIELQLQWRVGYSREFVGADALRARRVAGTRSRVTCFTAAQSIASGARVRLAGIDVGQVLVARESPTLGLTVGSALLDIRYAHPHLTLSADDDRVLRTCTASLVDNASLHVQPHKHSYATRNAGGE